MRVLTFVFLMAIICVTPTRGEAQSQMNDNTTSIAFSGNYVEYQIPSGTTARRIEFNLKGADGGEHNGCNRKAGEGAVVRAVFPIGTGTNELRPGGYVRVVVGTRGESYGGFGDGGAGGGGGTGIIYSANNTNTAASNNFSNQSTRWIVLAVAGGGGGVSAGKSITGCSGGSNGKGGNTGTSGTSGGGGNSGGSNGNGGSWGSNDAGAGGGFLTNGNNSGTVIHGRRGWGTGGAGGASSTNGYTREGGFGYGGGGTGRNNPGNGGGGGGGYSGGGGGNSGGSGQGGGGGGSFINSISLSQYNSITGLQTTNTPEDGWANFTFRSAGNPEISCRTGEVRISGNNTRFFGGAVTDYHRIEVGQTITSFGFVIAGQTQSFIELDCSDVGSSRLSNQLMIVSSSSGVLAICHTNLEIKDNVAPVLTCNTPIVSVEVDGTYTIPVGRVRNTLVDNCGGVVSQVLSPSVIDCDDVGVATPVTLTVTDVSGNTDACTVVINPIDAYSPVARCQDVTLELTGNTTDLAPILVDDGSTDNCGIVSYVLSQSTFTAADIGENTVTLTVRDNYGNPRSCDAIVTVQDEILPVNWRYFTAARNAGKSVLLRWGTAQETNNSGFTIQRSTDGESWTSIGFKAASEAAVPNYQFEDEQPPASTLYYRLRQDDYDGSFAFSDIRQVEQNGEEEMIYPNPSSGTITIFSNLAQTVTIHDLQGRVVAEVLHAGNGEQQKELSFKPGLYRLHFQRSGKVLLMVKTP